MCRGWSQEAKLISSAIGAGASRNGKQKRVHGLLRRLGRIVTRAAKFNPTSKGTSPFELSSRFPLLEILIRIALLGLAQVGFY